MALIFSCQASLPTLKGVDSSTWKKDKNGCMGIRKSMIKAFIEQKEKLKTCTEMEVITLLGHPDQNELYVRRQKIYIYFFEPSSACSSIFVNPKKLVIRFNAMGIAADILIK